MTSKRATPPRPPARVWSDAELNDPQAAEKEETARARLEAGIRKAAEGIKPRK